MIHCPYCNHEELVGAIFCSECGEQLVFPHGTPTGSIHPTPAIIRDYLGNNARHSDRSPSLQFSTDEFMALNIIESGTIIPIRGKREVTLGRSGEGQPIIPDVDLTPYHGFEAGVSRLHVSIQINEQEITVTDLGSANGTNINDKKIASHSSHSIKHGDILTLGRMRIQILLRG
jgi:pSer/pThr/pTyr-binding forkhead associated (FHA) protein